jgi:hypothetical protein
LLFHAVKLSFIFSKYAPNNVKPFFAPVRLANLKAIKSMIMKKNEKSEQYPNKEQPQRKYLGPNERPAHTNETDTGQGAPGVQGQYSGTNSQDPQVNPGGTAPERENPDTMNQNGSMHVALGSRERDKLGKVDKRSKKSGR